MKISIDKRIWHWGYWAAEY